MGREKRKLPAAVTGGPKERHKRAQRSQYDPTAPVPEGFVAKPDLPKLKHTSYFEFVENKNKKKKLEFQITTRRTPPPGFEFVPIGNPELTTACKELSREKDAMIFIVSTAKDITDNLAHQVHRIGHHIRETIIEEAQHRVGQPSGPVTVVAAGSPEPIPESQDEYNKQVDAAIRDLFPRIPNTDRQMIIEHAFQMGAKFKGEKPVGLSEDITLARRVQLAVLAHIRHTHTRYDNLLKETTWQNARKVVEALCLDTLVKWRGDEETGRDQLDEILQEIVVISDSEEDEYDDDTDDLVEELRPPSRPSAQSRVVPHVLGPTAPGFDRPHPMTLQPQDGLPAPGKSNANSKRSRRKNSAERREQRGFKRYNAWQEAIQRSRQGEALDVPSTGQPVNGASASRANRPAMLLHDEFPASSQLRIVSERAGPPPNENGFVGRSHQPQNRQAVYPHQQLVSPPPRVPVRDQVRSPISGAIHSAPVAADRFRDMLVPSIEPASPEAMQPSFVRSVPPRRPVYPGDIINVSVTQHSPVVPSPSRGAHVREGYPHVTRVMTGSPLHSSRPYHSDHEQLEHQRRPRILGRDEHLAPVSSSHALRPFTGPADSRSVGLVTRRFQEVSGRSTPTVMEDRGGFYERVPVSQARPQIITRDRDLMQHGRALQEAPVISGRHSAPWQGGPHGLRDEHDPMGGIVATSRHQQIQPLPASAIHRPAYETHGAEVSHYVIREPEPRYLSIREPGMVPVSRPMLNHEPLRVIDADTREFGTRPAFEAYPREPTILDDRPRGQLLRRRQTDNVIVIE